MYSAYITTIKELRKHTNADRLQIATVFGNDVIVDLTYQIGQRVVYFPSDGQLSEEFATANNLVRRKDENGNDVGGYLDPVKRNITAIKLRGEKSDGLILPIKVLEPYTDTTCLKDGDQITVLNGHEICKKYIPKSNSVRHTNPESGKRKNKKKDEAKETYPFFAEHIDTEQLAYNQSAFKPGDTIYLTQKLHGTSHRVSNAIEETTIRPCWIARKLFRKKDKVKRTYKIVGGTRRMTLRNYDGGFYGGNEFRKQYDDFFADRLPKGFTVYGEIVGWVNEDKPIMGIADNKKVKDKEFQKQYGEKTIFSYGCKPGESHFYVYRITQTNEDGIVTDLPTEDVMYWCEVWGVDYVPLLDKFTYTTWEDLNERCAKYLDVPEPLANGAHVTEGVVVRIDNRHKFTAYKTKSFAFKVLEGIVKDNSDAPDMEEAQDVAEDEK